MVREAAAEVDWGTFLCIEKGSDWSIDRYAAVMENEGVSRRDVSNAHQGPVGISHASSFLGIQLGDAGGSSPSLH